MVWELFASRRTCRLRTWNRVRLLLLFSIQFSEQAFILWKPGLSKQERYYQRRISKSEIGLSVSLSICVWTTGCDERALGDIQSQGVAIDVLLTMSIWIGKRVGPRRSGCSMCKMVIISLISSTEMPFTPARVGLSIKNMHCAINDFVYFQMDAPPSVDRAASKVDTVRPCEHEYAMGVISSWCRNKAMTYTFKQQFCVQFYGTITVDQPPTYLSEMRIALTNNWVLREFRCFRQVRQFRELRESIPYFYIRTKLHPSEFLKFYRFWWSILGAAKWPKVL